MRVWDKVDPSKLCRQHLLAEHRETLAIWSILTNNKKGYRNHPEVLRWINRLPALNLRHNCIIMEAKRRGYKFKSLPKADFDIKGDLSFPEPYDNQIVKLRLKGCRCII